MNTRHNFVIIFVLGAALHEEQVSSITKPNKTITIRCIHIPKYRRPVADLKPSPTDQNFFNFIELPRKYY